MCIREIKDSLVGGRKKSRRRSCAELAEFFSVDKIEVRNCLISNLLSLIFSSTIREPPHCELYTWKKKKKKRKGGSGKKLEKNTVIIGSLGTAFRSSFNVFP